MKIHYELILQWSFSVGEDGTPNIRPLETLHNALSLRQVDSFLEQITNANYKTPTLSPKMETPPDILLVDEGDKIPANSIINQDEQMDFAV